MQYMWCAVLVFTWVHQLQEQHYSILVTRGEKSSRRPALPSLTSAHGGYAAATEQRYLVLTVNVGF